YLQNTGDPRIDYIYEEPATTIGHLGVVQGLLAYDTPTPGWAVPENVSNLGTGILKGPDQDVVIYSLAECYFNLAEAAINSFITDNAQTLYESGIEASFDYLGAPGASAYYGQGLPNVGWTASSSNQLEAIITQKWIATNSITAEQSWFDYSRTGYPSPAAFGIYPAGLPISLLADQSKDRPVRLFYPASEVSSNGANVPTQPDAFSAKIFWGL
ncbi:MAG: SusD/RagB family nutrient-binding outer membrane lipoprotein, partial [Bacteroidales bacterium]|nr:SusD/RagB family nutrient-binding outer membrane lipoprotein [Bacteroidales bacterium]